MVGVSGKDRNETLQRQNMKEDDERKKGDDESKCIVMMCDATVTAKHAGCHGTEIVRWCH